MQTPAWIERSTNRIVPFAWNGLRLRFRLSHGLFSSFDIDAGSRLLLETIAGLDMGSTRWVLDLGCGVGVIGICIAALATRSSVVLQDRDALAAAFAAENARANGAHNVSVECQLAFRGLESRAFDLILSNLPAKAGRPVLEHFLLGIPAHLAPSGIAGVVIVAPLEEFVRTTIARLGHQIIREERTQEHAVFHFRRGRSAPATEGTSGDTAARSSDWLSPYLRQRAVFSLGGTSWEMDTGYGLPDFDTLGYSLQGALDILGHAPPRGEVLFWNPGQGHLPVYALRMASAEITGILLAGRDSLELSISARNLETRGRAPRLAVPVPGESCLPEALRGARLDAICAMANPIPRVPWQRDLLESALLLLRPEGTLLVAGRSTEVHRFLEAKRGFALVRDRKRQGYRAVLLRKL